MDFRQWLRPTSEPASEAELSTLRDTIPVVDEELAKVWAWSNGADFVEGTVLLVSDGSVAGALVMLPVVDAIQSTKQLSRGRDVLFWARDGSGNYLVQGAEGVGFWNHDVDEIQPLAGSFDRLVERLVLREVEGPLTRAAGVNDFKEANPDTQQDMLLAAVEDENAVLTQGLLDAALLSDEQVREAVLWATTSSPRVLEVLIAYLGHPNIVSQRTGQSALMEAAMAGSLECVRVLIGFGADRTLRDSRGKSAQELAYMCMHDDVAAYLAGLE